MRALSRPGTGPSRRLLGSSLSVAAGLAGVDGSLTGSQSSVCSEAENKKIKQFRYEEYQSGFPQTSSKNRQLQPQNVIISFKT